MVNILIRKNARLASITCARVKQTLVITLALLPTKLLLKKSGKRRQLSGEHLLRRLMILFSHLGLKTYVKH
jgi:hypothetical protein